MQLPRVFVAAAAAWPMLALIQDTRFAWRALINRPLHALLTIAVLALAIGANTTVFSVFNGLFLRPLPYPDDDRLVTVYNTYPGLNLEYAGTSIPDYLDRRERAASLEQLGLYRVDSRTIGEQDAPERISVVRATASLFQTLGVGPSLGRTFVPTEAEPGADRVVVLSHRLWTSRFGARPDIVGTDIALDGQPHTVTGVMPEDFGFPDRDVAAWVPFAYTAEQASDGSRGQEFSSTIGRLRPGATVRGLNAELDRIVRENVELGRMPQSAEGLATTGFTGRARLLRDMRVGDARAGLVLLQGIVLAVLLMACANATNLQLARMENRRRELSVRRALGASVLRIGRLVVVESLLLAALGGAAGLALVFGGLELVRQLGLDASSLGFDYVLDARVLVFFFGIVVSAALMAVLLPLWLLSRAGFTRAVAESTRPAQGSLAAAGLRGTLVVAQVAVCVALLVAGGLLLRSFNELQQAGTGFSAENVWSGSVAFPATRYPTAQARARYTAEAIERLSALPGVRVAAFTSNLPFGSPDSQGSYAIENHEIAAGAPQPHARQRGISPGYFAALGVPLLAGRSFRASESEPVVIVDEVFVDRYFADGNVIGQRIREDFGPDDPWFTIIGVVPALKHTGLDEVADKETLYWHFQQNAPPFGSFLVRSLIEPERLTRIAATTLLEIDPLMAVSDMRTLQSRIDESLGPQRAPLALVLIFAFAAFLLAMIGVYGILTWSVSHRTGEIGVRMALGARAADVVRMVLAQGGRLVGIGLAIGYVAAVALGRVVAAQVPDVEPFDPMLCLIVGTGLVATAAAASWLPARRAAGIDPMHALRQE